MRARLAALLDVLSRDAAVARFYLIEPLAAGGEIAARYRDAMQLLAETLRPEPPLSEMDVEVRDQALMGGIATLIARRLKAGGARAAGRAPPRPGRARPRALPGPRRGPPLRPGKRHLRAAFLHLKNFSLHL